MQCDAVMAYHTVPWSMCLNFENCRKIWSFLTWLNGFVGTGAFSHWQCWRHLRLHSFAFRRRNRGSGLGTNRSTTRTLLTSCGSGLAHLFFEPLSAHYGFLTRKKQEVQIYIICQYVRKGANNIEKGNIENGNINRNLVLKNGRFVSLRKDTGKIEIKVKKDNIKKVFRN